MNKLKIRMQSYKVYQQENQKIMLKKLFKMKNKIKKLITKKQNKYFNKIQIFYKKQRT